MTSDDNDSDNLTDTEITVKHFDKILKPADTVSPKVVQPEYEETKSAAEPEETDYMETAKDEEVKSTEGKIRKPERSSSVESESKSLSKLYGDLRKHSDSARKTDLTLKNIQRKIKDLDKSTNSKHRQVIRDLQAQVKELQRKVDRIERSNRSTKSTISIKKTSGKKNKDKNKKVAKKKARRR